MKKINYGHQGDVEFRRIEVLPEGVKLKKDRTVAYGEITGHHHTFVDGAVYADPTTAAQYVVLDKPTVLTHQEHNDLEFPAGIYEIQIQKELDLLGQVRRVID